MKNLLKNLCLLLTGVLLGWWLNYSTAQQYKKPVPIASPASPVQSSSSIGEPESWANNQVESTALSGAALLPSAPELRQLLSQHRYKQSLAYYEQALLIDDSYQALLKPIIETYLWKCLQQCRNENFLELINLWLGTFYQDIPVLLILAERQRLFDTPEEAASTLQLASTYAIQTGDKENVSASLQALVISTDELLSSKQSWIELLGFYEFLQAVGLSTPTDKLRRSSLYEMLGEQQRSRELLLELRDDDDGMNSEWTAMLDSYLANFNPEAEKEASQKYATPVKRYGEHFIVTSTINDNNQLNLMIDTGASLTTLSQVSFSKLDDTYFEFQGLRMFNTANGLARGEVYKADSIQIGEVVAENIDIAVLAYEPNNGIDGLLGMNVLRNFRFEIDQDNNFLYLAPRH